MAFSLNRAQIIGNVTRDPESKMAGSSKVVSFSIATNFSWKDAATGERKEKVEFHNIVCWRGLADIAEKYLRKGGKVFVEGRMQTRDWQGEDGVKRYRSEIVAENLILLGGKGEAAGGMPPSYGANSESSDPVNFQTARNQRPVKEASDQMAQAPEEEVSIDDLPF